MLTFGIMEISLCMASLVTLEGGLKEASRYGITSQTDGPPDDNLVPTAFKVGNDPRLKMIGYILNRNTLDLINLDQNVKGCATAAFEKVVPGFQESYRVGGGKTGDRVGSDGPRISGDAARTRCESAGELDSGFS